MAEVVVTTKKRGRPPKNQQHVETDGDLVAAPKSRGRPASSASGVSVASTTRSGKAAKQIIVEELEEAVVVVDDGEKKPKASGVVKRKAAAPAPAASSASAVAVASKTPDATKSRKSPRPTTTTAPTTTTTTTSLATQHEHDVSALVKTERKTKAAKSVAKNTEVSRSAQKISQPRTTTTTTTTPAAADIDDPRLSISTILGHAKAFSKQSDQLQWDILQLIRQKEEAVLSQQLSLPHAESETQLQTPPTQTSQIPLAIDAIPVPPAYEPSSTMPPPVRGAVSTAPAPRTASDTPSHNPPALTSEPAHPFSTQTLASALSAQQAHVPPSSLLSSPLGSAQGPQHQVRPFSSTKALPMSTTIALAARSSSSAGSRPSMPPRPPTVPSEGPPGGAPKLSDLPLEQLKKDPRYRKASTRYTTFVVALPFAIVSSYFLWERYREHQAYLQKVRDARAKGPGSDDLASTTAASVPGQHNDRE
ncbi:hypothetical protein AYL99_10783 [Fonsecaea erecta]|uniref:Uncharacterized protein n=1 Tax=Fonsecaea erecta TaxID=1367422 RepID=A0A178Z7C5_9EURO|nr:hypothetical protein AYL99_10783 [Fonsecaea erecta]OAP55083.1 hypothetical protein AYL99_10783 [Fonsecaea erecta]